MATFFKHSMCTFFFTLVGSFANAQKQKAILLWMPVEIGEGKLWVPEPKPWTLDVKTGAWKYAE